jgi:alpha-amylase/alpha-mannosidase (GH57 family)
MTGTNVCHALGLHMHQPPGNLKLLIESNAWEAEQIIRCYERVARYAARYGDVAHLHVGFSGVLLEQLLDPAIVDAYRHIVDIPEMLAGYREAPNVELIGMGYYHPIFPLIPKSDWDEQLEAGRRVVAEVFGDAPRGFWPPEMAFSMEMIPALVKAGYEYLVVDGVHVRPEDGVNDIYRPYLACRDGFCITVVPRDRVISNAQESGLDPQWFARESLDRTRGSPRPSDPRLVTTWSDGENGGWFRQTHEASGFFGHFFSPYMEEVRLSEFPVIPVGLSDYLKRNPPSARAEVQTGAWNVGSTSGCDFTQWAGSERQKMAAGVIHELSRRYWDLRRREPELSDGGKRALEDARSLILEGETSCFLFWGDAWLPHLNLRMSRARRELDLAERDLSSSGPNA